MIGTISVNTSRDAVNCGPVLNPGAVQSGPEPAANIWMPIYDKFDQVKYIQYCIWCGITDFTVLL